MADRSKSGVDDSFERWGEMLLALIGSGYAIFGGLTGVLSNMWSAVILFVSFGLYQGTTILKYFFILFVGGKDVGKVKEKIEDIDNLEEDK